MSAAATHTPGESGERPRFFATLDEREAAAVLGYAEARRYATGELVIRRGEVDRSLYFVTGGVLEVLVPTPDGIRQVGVLRAGAVFGDLAFFDGEPRSADVRALETAEVLVLTPAAFERLRAADPRLALAFVVDLGRMLSTRFRDVSQRLAAALHRP